MVNAWIIGCGKFGSRAVEHLLRKTPNAAITVVDPDPVRLTPWRDSVEGIADDGVEFLTRHLKAGPLPEWIIAAAPIHVAYQWALKNVHGVELEPIPIPEPLVSAFPNPFRGKEGEIFISHADFICPEDCPEPPDRCTVTGRPRKENLYDLVESLHRPGWSTAVLRSRLLLPGVGGYSPDALFQLKSRIESVDGNLLIGTACRCHGVLQAVRTSRCGLPR